MLELRNIVKDYVNGNNVTHALKGISVNFRKSEFVSILGASGCGKTTSLNIIGGLDRYTDGDLLINGVSTKEYTDRDWDTYRNHSIGFVFQTYNLISHQNILKNVELALTISGVSKEERRKRAYEVLKIVGLEGMEKKKPNQLSGGQCQRVAIARALINNPEILLADEPTGALDSETSIQIMDLLKEVASDRLVIMVTHNPELALKYSTRIIKMSDGLLIDDSNPFIIEHHEEVEKSENSQEFPAKSKKIAKNNKDKNRDLSKGNKKQTSMSIWTSIGLSTSNLFSKLKRTILVTIAGSIGIIGVSAVLGVSRGVKDYIGDLQNDMLSAYPIKIEESSLDYTSFLTGFNARDAKEKFEFDINDPKIGVDSMINYLMDAYSDITNIKTNVIDDRMLDWIDQMPRDDVGVITYDYGIDPTNNIFGKWKDEDGNEDYYSFNGLTQRYIAELKTVNGFGAYATFVDLFTSFMHEIPDDEDYISSQYEVVAGKDPYTANEDDLILVVDENTTLTDVLLAQMGVFDHDSFLNVAKCAMHEQEEKKKDGFDKKTQAEKDEIINAVREKYPYERSFSINDILKRQFYYFPQDTIYTYDDAINTENYTSSLSFLLLDGGNFDTFLNLTSQNYLGFNALVGTRIIEEGGNLKKENIICFSMDPTSQIKSKSDFVNPLGFFGFSLDDDTLANIYTIYNNPLLSDATKMTQLASLCSFRLKINDVSGNAAYFKDPTDLYTSVPVECDLTVEPNPIKGYAYEAIADPSWTVSPESKNGISMKVGSILKLKEGKNFGSLQRGLYYTHDFAEKFVADSRNATTVTKALKDYVQIYTNEFNDAYVKFKYRDFSDESIESGTLKYDGYASTLNTDLTSSFSDLFAGFSGGADAQEKNSLHLRSLCGEKISNKYDVNGNFDHIEFEYYPKSINIYPKSFEGKDSITNHLDRWNSDESLTILNKTVTKAERDDLTYSDTISLIAAVINTFIDAITIALVVFTSLSLVVSCFMIAVITYISVVERIKEIGVIRSLGGRKRDVANLFVMETLMTGLFSGVFGVLLTYVIQIIVNLILVAKFAIAIMHLTLPTAFLMIGISVALSVLSGLIPSQSAAHKDPVIALRSNE